MEMNLADLLLAALGVLALLYGWRRGTINVIAHIGSLVIAYRAARAFSGLIAVYLSGLLPGKAQAAEEGSRQLLGFLSLFINTEGVVNRVLELILFAAIFLLVNWLVRKLAYLLTDVFGRGFLGKINSFLGAIIALLLICGIALIAVNYLLPACVKMGFGQSWLDFLSGSRVVLPFLQQISLPFS